jgi:hypothetical protein
MTPWMQARFDHRFPHSQQERFAVRLDNNGTARACQVHQEVGHRQLSVRMQVNFWFLYYEHAVGGGAQSLHEYRKGLPNSKPNIGEVRPTA